MRSSAARAEAAERRLLQAQRLESLSVLAGGIAHQLNNLLMVIMGNASLAATALEADDPLREYLVEIESASQQAARLARQMLAYSGRGGFMVRPVDLNEVVRSACAAFTERVPAARRRATRARPGGAARRRGRNADRAARAEPDDQRVRGAWAATAARCC